MTDIRIEKESGELHPFQEDVDVRNFYSGGQRGEILEEILAAVRRGTSILILSGEGGSGKTMVCRVIERRLADEAEVVVFPRTVESFDDVVRKIALRLGIEVAPQTDRKNTESYLSQILEYLQQATTPVLIVFDEAENLYLATLERIRKMQDRMTEKGGRLQLLFSGRRTFLENNEQLSICNFINSDEVSFSLPLLEDDEAYDYLQYGLTQLEQEGADIARAVERLPTIVESGAGNFGNLNAFIRQVLDTSGDDSSITDQLGDVDEEQGEESLHLPRIQMPTITFPEDWRRYLGYGTGLIIVFLVAIWFWPSGEGKKQAVVESQVVQIESPPSENIDSAQTGSENVDQGSEQGAGGENPNLVTDLSSELSPDVVQEENDLSLEESAAPADVEEETPDSSAASATSDDAGPQPVAGGDAENGQDLEAASDLEAPGETVISDEPPAKIVILTPGKAIKRKPDVSEQKKEEDNRKEVSEVQEVIATNAQFTADQLYRKRILAGQSWKVGKRNDMYTVQLMVLTSKTSEENLKQMLAIDEYRQEAGNFFVFRKRSVPDVIFIFYGEYPTMSFARIVKNSLPPFLQKHKPYALSIKGAMAKVNR